MALHFPITSDNRQFISTLNESQRAVESAMRNIESSGDSVERMFSRIERAAAFSVAGFSLKGIIDQAIETRSYFEDIESSMRVFLGSQEKAVEFTKELQDAAYYNMFEFADLADASKQLIAYRNNVEDVIPIINKLSEVATATKTPLAEMINLYNRAKSTGTVDSNAIQSWATKGLVLKDVMKDLGIVTAGTSISFEQLNMALDHVTSEGGMFHGIMNAQMENLSANIGQLEDNLSLMFNDIGANLQGVANIGIKAAGELVDHWQEALGVISTIAVSYGVNKAVEVGGIAINKTATTYGYSVEAEQLRALLPVKEEEEKTTLQQAVASGRLSEAKAKEIEVLRQEADAQLEALIAKESAAKADEAAAISASKAADEEILRLKNVKESLLEMYTEATNAGEAEEAQSIATSIATVETELKEAADNALTLAENARTASTNAATASEARETLATQINTAQTSGNAAATNILAIAKEKLSIAVAKVNAVLKANQFALITAAVIALGTAIYKLCTYQTEYEKGLQRLDDASNSLEKSISSETHEVDVLFGKLEKAKEGTEAWDKAKDAIWSKYGQYLKKLGDEKTALNDIAAAYKLVKDEALGAAKARAMDSFLKSEGDSYAQDMGEYVEKAYQLIKDRKGETYADIHMDDIRDYVEGHKDIDSNLLKEFDKIKVLYDGVSYTDNQLNSILLDAEKRRETQDKLIKEAERRFGTSASKNDQNEIEEKQTTYQEAFDKAKKAYEDKKAAVESMYKDKRSYTAEAYEKASQELKDLKAAYEKLGGITKDKSSGKSTDQIESQQKQAAQKILDLMKNQAEERLRLQQECEYQIWQNRIDLMDEGEAKTLEQQRLNNAKELTAIEQQKHAAVDAEISRQKAIFDAMEDEKSSKIKGYGKQIFNPLTDVSQDEIKAITTRYDSLYNQLIQKQEKAGQDRLFASKESMNAYLKEFGSYQEKRLAITEDYETKISEAQNEGERMMLTAQRNKALSDLDYEEWVDTGSIALAFKDVTKLSESTVDTLIADMERYRDKVIHTLDPEKIQKYEEALSSLRRVKSDESFGVISSFVPDYFKDRKSVSDQMDSAAKNVNSLYEQRASILLKINGLENAINLTKIKGGKTSQMEKDLAELNVQLNANETATKKAKIAFRQLKEQWDQLETPQAKFEAFCGVISNISGMISGLSSHAVDMADAIGSDGLSSAFGTLGEAMDSVGNIASGFAQGGLIGGIAAAAGEIMGWASKIFSAGDRKHEQNIERIQKQIDTLNKSYERLGDSVDEAFSTDASKLIDQQNTLLQQQKVLIRQQMAEEEAKKKTDDDKIKDYKDQLEEIDSLLKDNKQKAKDAIVGEDVKSAINEFSSLYAGAWDDGTDAAHKSMQAVKSIITSALNELLKKNIQPSVEQFHSALAEAMKDGYLSEEELLNLDIIKGEIDALASLSEEQYEKIQQRYKDLDELREELTDISFDSVRDNFKSRLTDMKSDAKDFIGDFSDMLRNGLVEGLMNNKYDVMLKEWYDEFAEAMNDKKLTDSERDTLRQKYESIVNQGIADRDFIKEIVGNSGYSQEATKGWATSLTQDQGDELNGRFTAMVELEAINNSLVSEGNLIVAQILSTLQNVLTLSTLTSPDDSTLLAIRDMMFLSTGFLEDIAKHSKALNIISEGISSLNDLINKRL